MSSWQNLTSTAPIVLESQKGKVGRHSGLLSDETLCPIYKMMQLLFLEDKTVDLKPYNIFIRNLWKTINYNLHGYTFTAF